MLLNFPDPAIRAFVVVAAADFVGARHPGPLASIWGQRSDSIP